MQQYKHKLCKIAVEVLLGLFFVCSSTFGQSVTESRYVGRAYPTGNFIFCGKELPVKFSYLIEKQGNNGEWKSIAELKAPASLAECKARLMSMPAAVASITKIDPAITDFIWKNLCKPNSTLDSLYAYSSDPRYQYVAGTAWFDDDIHQPGSYKYRVSRLTRSGDVSVLGEVSVSFPAKPSGLKAQPLRYKLNPSGVSISYEVSDRKSVAGLKLFRSMYLQKKIQELSPDFMFTSQKGKMVAELTDNDITKGLTYSYVAVPYDGLGNCGVPSDTVNVYAVSAPGEIGLVTGFTVTPIPEKAGNLLKWSYRRSAYVNLVEIYRSVTYNGSYKKIASLGAKQTEYFDGLNIKPAITYFYYIVINNGLGNSLPSARIPSILEGKKQNIVPPQDLTLVKKGNVVTLKFRRVGKDVRGYYVYRGDGYTAPLLQLPRMLLSTDSLLAYTDTLPASVTSSVYSYTVASVNTSYAISPMSNRVNISYSGGRLPAPSISSVNYQDKKVMVIWDDAAGYNNAITGYQLFRKAVNDNREEGKEKLVGDCSFSNNYFEDKDILPGRDYSYRVRCITADTAEVSSFSLPYTVYVPADVAVPPGQVSAMVAENKILLRWTLPLTDGLEAVQVYRAAENEKETVIKTLPSAAESFEDGTAKKGTMYYYFITIKYKNGQESRPSDAVSAKL